MNLLNIINKVQKIIQKRFRKPILIQQRPTLKSLKTRILSEEFGSLVKIEEIIKAKGKTSKEVSKVKSKYALDFFQRHFNVKFTLEQQKRTAELMADLEQREKAVKFVKRNPLKDEMANEIRRKLVSTFQTKKDYLNFVSTYRILDSAIRQILKQAGY
jgi:hypothetical protein